MDRRLLFLSVLAFLGGCAGAKTVTYKVVSSPSNARVDVNGVSVGQTPTEIQMDCDRGTYEVSVYLTSAMGGRYSQSKRVDPCKRKEKTAPVLEFDLGLQSLSPAQPAEGKTATRPVTAPPNQQELLENLKKLHTQGALSDADYKEKALKVIEDSGR